MFPSKRQGIWLKMAIFANCENLFFMTRSRAKKWDIVTSWDPRKPTASPRSPSAEQVSKSMSFTVLGEDSKCKSMSNMIFSGLSPGCVRGSAWYLHASAAHVIYWCQMIWCFLMCWVGMANLSDSPSVHKNRHRPSSNLASSLDISMDDVVCVQMPCAAAACFFFTWTCRVFKSCVDENGGKSMEISFVTRVIHQELPHGSKCLPRSKSPGWFFYTSTNQQSVKEAGCSHLDYVSCQLKSCQCRHVSWHMYRHICHGLCRLCIVTYVCVLVGIYVGMHPRVVLTPTVYYKLT